MTRPITKRQLLSQLGINGLGVEKQFTLDELKQVAEFRQMDSAAARVWLDKRNEEVEVPAGAQVGFEPVDPIYNRIQFQYSNHPDFSKPRHGSKAENLAQMEEVIWKTLATSLVPGGSATTLLYLLANRAPLKTLREFDPHFSGRNEGFRRSLINLHRVANVPGVSSFYDNDVFWEGMEDVRLKLGAKMIPPTNRWYFAPVPPEYVLLYLALWLESYGADPVGWVLAGCPRVDPSMTVESARPKVVRLDQVRNWVGTMPALGKVVRSRLHELRRRTYEGEG